nr:hypothetical protein [Acinetobacter sp. Marseille-Q1620]
MLLKTEINRIKPILSFLLYGLLASNISHAQIIDCEKAPKSQKLCQADFNVLRDELDSHYLTAYLITDAPIRLLNDTNKLWLNYAQQCKTNNCLKNQLDNRVEDFNFYTSMNQSLTQHYLKYENGKISKLPIHIQVHQLSKDRIKIEGLAFRNPNNKKDTQTVALLAYTTPEQKSEVLDNERNCKYQLNFQKAILEIKTMQKGCEKFTGIYRLYD